MAALGRLPFHPLLLAAYAVLSVYAANVSEVLPADLVAPLAAAIAAAGGVLVVAALAYRDARRGAVVATAVVVAVAFFGHVGTLVDAIRLAEVGQIVAWGIVVGLAGVYALRAGASLASVTAGLNGFGLVLVGLALATIVPFEASRVTRVAAVESVSEPAIASATKLPGRDIFFLVFDRYGSDWSIEQRFGIRNDLAPDLEAAGFQVVPGARANYRATDFSLATILNMRLLDDLTTTVGRASSDRTPARERIPEHDVGRFLQANGYRYVHLGSWYEPTRVSPIADESLRWGHTTELESVLRDATMLPALERVLGLATADTPFRDRHREEALFQFRQLERLVDTPGDTFVFAHILLPHPPYGFDAEGRRVLRSEEQATPEADLFAAQLAYTNDRIRHLVDVLLDRPADEQPIIVITGDEGPFLCFNDDCVDGTPETLGIRYGTLRAYYLPGLDITIPPDDSGVNIFRTILREYFGADLPRVPDRSYDWPDNDHLYDFRDVTDRLPLPGGTRADATSLDG